MRTRRFLLPILLLSAAAPTTFAQTSCLPSGIAVEGPPFFEAWVDNSVGDDLTGVVSEPDGLPSVTQAKAAPFKTIQAAIDAVAGAVNLPDEPGLVHLQPGTYDPTTQTFPIRMKNGVNVQGVSARECVLRKGATQTVFVPDEDCDCGIYVPARVLVDFSTSTGGPVYSEAIDGVTFQGSHVQVYAAREAFIRGRVSNCIFDMVDYGPALRGPEFGILMVHEYHPVEPNYREIFMDVFNNTFVMGWLPNGYGGTVFACSPSAVGICDVNNPLCGDKGGEDPDSSLRGIGLCNIQNNLFRELNGASSTAFMGVAYEDTSDSNGIPTNIFLNTTEHNGTYCVAARPGSFGLPASAVSYDDPAHVGEMLTNFLGQNMLNVGRDWRILPDSIAVDAGVGPTNGVLVAFNGLVYTEPSVLNADCRYSAIDSFDFDGEGYGNRRVVGSQIDVGFDEFELLVDGGLGNESLRIPASANPCAGLPGDPCYCAPFAGAGIHRMIVKGGGTLKLRIQSVNCPTAAYSRQPGTILPPTPMGSSFFWFSTDQTILTAPLTPTLHTTYVPPDSTIPHRFGIVTRSSTNNGMFRLFQGQYGGVWSNLQATVD